MLMGDLNAEPTEAVVSDFCEIYNLKHSIKEKTCFKNSTKPTCIDLIVTNSQNASKVLWYLKQGYQIFIR